MKLLAQHGFNDGDKTRDGLSKGLIDGVLYSSKDISFAKLETCIREHREINPDAFLALDPQFYASLFASDPNARLGKLAEDYTSYFGARRRSQLEDEDRVLRDLKKTMDLQKSLNVSAIIAPNILIPRSFNSIEAAISKDFIRNTRPVYKKNSDDQRLVFATLAVSRNALLDKEELIAFLNDITLMENSPDGFYLLVSVNSSEARSEIFNSEVIAGWMFLNYVLNTNGFKTLNGYSDLLSPFLSAAGGDYGATGWFGTLRAFSMDRFLPSATGGQQAVTRYLSMRLLSRITFYELHNLRGIVPNVLNGFGSDSYYDIGTGSEPARNTEVFQSWEALRSLITEAPRGSFDHCVDLVDDARKLYAQAELALPTPWEKRSGPEHLDDLLGGISSFRKLAEL
jgi:hypothetical protein